MVSQAKSELSTFGSIPGTTQSMEVGYNNFFDFAMEKAEQEVASYHNWKITDTPQTHPAWFRGMIYLQLFSKILRYDFNYLFSPSDAIGQFRKWTMMIG